MKKYLKTGRNMIPTTVIVLKIILTVIFWGAALLFVNFVPDKYAEIYCMGLCTAEITICVIMDCFLDYFCFAGISSRREKGEMNMVRAAFGADRFIRNSLIGEMIIRAFFDILLYIPICFLMLYRDSGNNEGTPVIAYFTVLFFCFTCVNLITILTRRIGLSLHIHMILSYFLGSIGGILIWFLNMWIVESQVTVISVLLPAFGAASEFVTSVLLLKDCCSGFNSGFHDAKKA